MPVLIINRVVNTPRHATHASMINPNSQPVRDIIKGKPKMPASSVPFTRFNVLAAGFDDGPMGDDNPSVDILCRNQSQSRTDSINDDTPRWTADEMDDCHAVCRALTNTHKHTQNEVLDTNRHALRIN